MSERAKIFKEECASGIVHAIEEIRDKYKDRSERPASGLTTSDAWDDAFEDAKRRYKYWERI